MVEVEDLELSSDEVITGSRDRRLTPVDSTRRGLVLHERP